MDDYKSSFRKLVDVSEAQANQELDGIRVITASRMENLLHCLESGAEKIRSLESKNAELRAQLEINTVVASNMVGDIRAHG